MTGRAAPRGNPRRVVVAPIRMRVGRPGLRSVSCGCIAVLGVLVGLTTMAMARLPSLPVLVQANLSDRGGSPTVKGEIRSAANARCQIAVDADKRNILLSAVTTDARGRAAVTWHVPTGTPSGRWIFDVSCAKGRRTGRGSDHVVVSSTSASTPPKVEPSAPPPTPASFPGGPGSGGSPPQGSGATTHGPLIPSEDPSLSTAAPDIPSEATPTPSEAPTEVPIPPTESPSATATPPDNQLEAELPPTPTAPQPASLRASCRRLARSCPNPQRPGKRRRQSGIWCAPR